MSRVLPNYDAPNLLAARVTVERWEQEGGNESLACKIAAAVIRRIGSDADKRALAAAMTLSTYHIEVEQEDDGRWIAEVMELPGVMVYGDSPDSAIARVKALALRVLAEAMEMGEGNA
jgi:predicted RNase H-like HicB family nuclease